MIAFVYLYDGERWSERSMGIMQVIARAIVSLAKPFVLIGDLNMSPNVFSQGGFLELVRGNVQAFLRRPFFGTLAPFVESIFRCIVVTNVRHP